MLCKPDFTRKKIGTLTLLKDSNSTPNTDTTSVASSTHSTTSNMVSWEKITLWEKMLFPLSPTTSSAWSPLILDSKRLTLVSSLSLRRSTPESISPHMLLLWTVQVSGYLILRTWRNSLKKLPRTMSRKLYLSRARRARPFLSSVRSTSSIESNSVSLTTAYWNTLISILMRRVLWNSTLLARFRPRINCI